MVRLATSCDLSIWRTCTLYDTLLFNNDWSRVFSLAKKWEAAQNTSSLVRQRRLLRVARRAECLSALVFHIHSGYNINCRWVFKRRQDYATPGGLPSLVLVYWTSPRGHLTLDDSQHLWAFDELLDRTFEVDCIDVFGSTENAASWFIESFPMPR